MPRGVSHQANSRRTASEGAGSAWRAERGQSTASGLSRSGRRSRALRPRGRPRRPRCPRLPGPRSRKHRWLSRRCCPRRCRAQGSSDAGRRPNGPASRSPTTPTWRTSLPPGLAEARCSLPLRGGPPSARAYACRGAPPSPARRHPAAQTDRALPRQTGDRRVPLGDRRTAATPGAKGRGRRRVNSSSFSATRHAPTPRPVAGSAAGRPNTWSAVFRSAGPQSRIRSSSQSSTR